MSLFSCKACPSHASHINSLKAEIESLRRLVHMPIVIPSAEQRQADRLLSGQEQIRIPSSTENQQLEEDMNQAEAIFSGEYESGAW